MRIYFADDPILAEIAWCESSFRHYDVDGKVIRGFVNSSDIGVMQINEYYHGDTAEKLGYNLHRLMDNLAYAKNLYEREGVRPWQASRNCWAKHEQEKFVQR